jgi:hypothetical protein
MVLEIGVKMVHTRLSDVRRSRFRLMMVGQSLLGRINARGVYSCDHGPEVDDMLVGGSLMAAIVIANQSVSRQSSHGNVGASDE